jgi:hypothetical protein
MGEVRLSRRDMFMNGWVLQRGNPHPAQTSASFTPPAQPVRICRSSRVPVVSAIRQATSINAAAANQTRRSLLGVELTPGRERTPSGELGVMARANRPHHLTALVVSLEAKAVSLMSAPLERLPLAQEGGQIGGVEHQRVIGSLRHPPSPEEGSDAGAEAASRIAATTAARSLPGSFTIAEAPNGVTDFALPSPAAGLRPGKVPMGCPDWRWSWSLPRAR